MNKTKLSVDLQVLLKKITEYLGNNIKPGILIIGDTPLDVYWICRTSRKNFHQDHAQVAKQSQFDVKYEIKRPGTVYANAKLLKELGYPVSVITCLGEDETGKFIAGEYNKLGINLIAPIIKGASFQRHYILNESEFSGEYHGRYDMVQRINHEPDIDNGLFSKNDFATSHYEKIRDALLNCQYILINDTQKGTLTWHDGRGSGGIKAGILHHYFIDQTKLLNKEITILDSRRSIEYYKDVKIRLLTSSTYEVEMSLKHFPDNLKTHADPGSALEKGLLKKLNKDYPDIENWALTRGANGIQLGISDYEERTMNCFIQPVVVNQNEVSGFTPHCGDFFDAGVITGFSSGLDIAESITFGSLLGGLQACQTNAEVISKDNIMDAVTTYSSSSAKHVQMTQLFSIKMQ